jgi:hypothetical protein
MDSAERTKQDMALMRTAEAARKRLGWREEELARVAQVVSATRWEAWVICSRLGRPFVLDAAVRWRLAVLCKMVQQMEQRLATIEELRYWMEAPHRGVVAKGHSPRWWLEQDRAQLEGYWGRLQWWLALPYTRDLVIARLPDRV